MRRRVLLGVMVSFGLALVPGTGHVSADQIPDTNIDYGQATQAVPAATCGPGSSPQTGLDGQVPMADRLTGRSQQGYSCNLSLVGQYREGEGANWMNDWYGHCDYYDTTPASVSVFASQQPHTRTTPEGVQVIDVSDPAHPVRSAVLNTPAMNSPHESLKVNQKRGLLAADLLNGNGFDIYDVSQDCAHPKLLASVTDPSKVGVGHEGDFSPDGLTYYADSGGGGSTSFAMDVSDPTNPRLITSGFPNGHGLAVSDDGTRLYTVSLPGPGAVGSPTAPLPGTNVPAGSGLLVQDVTQIQKRIPPYQAVTLSTLAWYDGAIAQVPIPMTINGKKYLAFVDEGGWGNARIIDMSDELHPKIVSRLHLEINLLQNRAQSTADGANGVIDYDGHYCSVPQEVDPQILMCAYAWSGIRVFDIRDPANPKEIAYYVPKAFPGGTNLPGSQDSTYGLPNPGNTNPAIDSIDRCSAKIRLFHAADGSWQLWTQCQENEFIVLKFTNAAFPFTTAAVVPEAPWSVVLLPALGFVAGMTAWVRRRRRRMAH